MLDVLVTRFGLFCSRHLGQLTPQVERLYLLLELGRRIVPLGFHVSCQHYRDYDAVGRYVSTVLSSYDGDYKPYFSGELGRLQSRVKISLGY